MESIFCKCNRIAFLFVIPWSLFLSCGAYSMKVMLKATIHDLKMEVGKSIAWQLSLSQNLNESLQVQLYSLNGAQIAQFKPEEHTLLPTSRETSFTILVSKAGHDTVIANASLDYIDVKEAFVRLSASHYNYLDTISAVIGWIYFCTWTVSFYPQIYVNWKLKNVVGLSFDYLGLNVTGFLAYAIFSVSLYFLKPIQEEYLSINPYGLIPVELNDVVFALHAVFATFVVVIQCCIYEGARNQRASKLVILLLAAVYAASIIFAIVILSGAMKSNIPWLTYLYYFSYTKLGITLCKCCPQVYYNFRRKSTVGWSIEGILLDFVGGILSILQMLLLAYNYDDWWSIFGNFTKFGLGLISILFDVIFMVQHYVLYKNQEPQLLPSINCDKESSSASLDGIYSARVLNYDYLEKPMSPAATDEES